MALAFPWAGTVRLAGEAENGAAVARLTVAAPDFATVTCMLEVAPTLTDPFPDSPKIPDESE